ncbi:MAG: FHA domain-containing protein [Betaproteobacteria bacterium]|uniref:FHA domain-containing protein n=1 Tax=Candidatus Proximibacter danicus TaxID=2954365 RepID=A0A9D7JYT1_9PROT|nr:FHA domain-containing protein [Candidatus Proximibacter danicus]MBK9446010.1 FHA domain-containing protein [Betaproteobacteria bacterium]
MAKMILSMDGLVLKEIPLTKERMTLGRKPHNDIQIDNLAISGEHAAVVTILNDSFLEDLNSTNGTLVNGQPVKKHFLKNGDVVELGKYKLKYIAEQAAQVTDAADFEKTMVLRPNMIRPAPAADAAAPSVPPAAPLPGGSPAVGSETAPAPKSFGDTHAGGLQAQPSAAPAATPALAAAIQILNGANAGRELELTKTLTTLGKPGVQVAVIAKRPHGFFITHVEGAQFPVVNGKTLDAQAHQLEDHDVIEIAGVKMEFFFKT